MRSLSDLFTHRDAKSASPSKGIILFIDDDETILRMIGDRLRLEGFVVYAETRGEEALAKMETISADLIILDISMPGLGGLGFLRRLSETFHPARCPIIVFSARHELETFFTNTSVTAFIPKTCDPDVLIHQIHQLISQHAPVQPPPPASPPNRWKLLLIENDRDYRDHLVRMFHRNGFEVHHLPEDTSLLDTASSVNPHVILIKYMLPRQNGPALAEQLGSHAPTHHIPVILYDDTGLHTNMHHYPNVKSLVASSQGLQLLNAVLQVVRPVATTA
ncbi:MAG: response regulator [bacterium]